MPVITPTERTAVNGETYLADGRGFPVERCGRCQATGYTSFTWVHGGVCFSCTGAGYVFPKGKTAKLAAEYAEIRRAATKVTLGGHWNPTSHEITCDLNPGDEIRWGRMDDWRTVTAIRITRRVIGEAYVGAGDNKRCTGMTLAILVTFADGETSEQWGVQADRRGDVEALRAIRDRLAGEARTAYEATLARRAARRQTSVA